MNHEQIRRPVTLVFTVEARRPAGSSRQSRADFLRPLSQSLGCARQHLILAELPLIDIKHILHRVREVAAVLRRNAPAPRKVRFQIVFFNVLLTVSREMLSTTFNAASRSPSRAGGCEERPSGGSEQAVIVSFASPSPSSFGGTRFNCGLRLKPPSPPRRNAGGAVRPSPCRPRLNRRRRHQCARRSSGSDP